MDKSSDSKLSAGQSSKILPRAGAKPLPQATPLPATKKAPIAQKTQPEAIPVAALVRPAENTVKPNPAKPADDDVMPILILDETAPSALPARKAAPASDNTAGNETAPAWDDSEVLPVTTSVSKIHRRKTEPVPPWQPIAAIAAVVLIVGGVVTGLLVYFRGNNQVADNGPANGGQTDQTPLQLLKAAHNSRPNPSAAMPRVVPRRRKPIPRRNFPLVRREAPRPRRN